MGMKQKKIFEKKVRILTGLTICPIKIAKVNKHPEFEDNFNIRCQLEHFEYEMNQTTINYLGMP